MSQLKNLAQHRNTILLAEAISWLHDYRKCSEEQLQVQSANRSGQGIPRNELTNRFNSLSTTTVTIASTQEQVADLLNQWSGKADDANASFLLQYLSRCHNTAHFDKQEPFDSGKQNYPGTQNSTAFGFETPVGANLTSQLWALPWNDLASFSPSSRRNLLNVVQTLFTTVGADTRRPINEINLWDWGMLVGALYKTAIAATVLGHQPATRDLHWRLLAVRTDGLAYLTQVYRLPDLFGRQKALQIALKNVQTLLEETYPLATEVYRDENGALYVVPVTSVDLLNLKNGNNETLLSLIQQEFATDGEIVPQVTLDSKKWWGQDPDRQGNDELPPAGKLISSAVILQSDASAISDTWQDKQQTICPICGIRPVISSQVEYCQVCGERRKGRVGEWLEDPSATIWLDEVADENGRLALIVGAFELSNWLDGSLVETLLVREPGNGNQAVTKTPSFARLRRIWQTTQTFWKQSQIEANQMLTDARRRLKICLANSPNLTPNQTYELDLLGQTRMSVLWDGAHLISTDNLSYTAAQLGISADERKTPVDAALAVGTWLEGCKDGLLQLTSDDEKNKRFDIQIADVDYQDTAYAPVIPILAEPRTFMALVPANKALDVVQAIKAKYEREIGKVRNRLPLHLGVVYAGRRTPLRAVLDAGRRMLKQPNVAEAWKVTAKKVQPDEGGTLPERFQTSKDGQFRKWFETSLEKGGRQLTWHVPAKMGDGQAEDDWYPYAFLKTDAEPVGRERRFQAPNPWTGQDGWLVHAGDLKPGDTVYFTPATLDFQWLDSSARRFEIAYDKEGQRLDPALKRRPYLLDDLAKLDTAWRKVGGQDGLSRKQIHALRDLIETKRAEWRPTQADCQAPDSVFRQFCRDALLNAQWPKDHTPNKAVADQLTAWAVSGLLTDAIELHMQIMK